MAKKEIIKTRAPQARDDFNDPTGAVSAWVELSAVVVPRESSEYNQRGPIIISGFLLRLPASAEVSDQHEFEVRGKIYQIEGAVADFGRKGKIVYVGRAN